MPCIIVPRRGGFVPAGMTHSGAVTTLGTSLAQVAGWVAEGDSTVTGGNTLIVPASGMADLVSSVPFSASGGVRTVAIEIRVNGTAAATGGGSLPAFSTNVLFSVNTASSILLPAGAAITYWASATASTGSATISSSPSAYLRAQAAP